MTKDLSYYLKLEYPILITKDEDEGEVFYEAEIPELPGCGAAGMSRDEALERLEESKEIWMAARLKRNLPIPEPTSEDDFSGKYLLRITPELHMQLATKAKKEGLSLNLYLRKTLETSITLETVLERIELVEREVIRSREKTEIPVATSVTVGIGQIYQSGLSGYGYNATEGMLWYSADTELIMKKARIETVAPMEE